MSRRKAKELLDVAEFQEQMKGIYTTTATSNTIDEAPMAYKDKDMIIEAIAETVDIEYEVFAEDEIEAENIFITCANIVNKIDEESGDAEIVSVEEYDNISR